MSTGRSPTSPLSPTAQGPSDPISSLKELVESENRLRVKEKRLLFTLPEVHQDKNGDWVAMCKYTSFQTGRSYSEVGKVAGRKKDAQREACRLVLLKINNDLLGVNRSLSRLSISNSTPIRSSSNPAPTSSPIRASSSAARVANPGNFSSSSTLSTESEAHQVRRSGNARRATVVQHSVFYFSETKLGSGGFGTVYEGYFEDETCRAAVKEIDSGPQSRIVKQEVDLMRKLNHPNVVRYFASEYDITNGKTYIAMDLASGNLDDIIKQKKYQSFDQLRLYVNHAAIGLSYLHQEKVIHRDITPNNILIFLQANLAKIGDFGISRLVPSVTQGGVTQNFTGNKKWIPPESYIPTEQGGFTYACHLDIFSLGLVIFYVMSPNHCHPFEEGHNIRPSGQLPNWSHLQDSIYYFPLRNLLSAMLSPAADGRPLIDAVVDHPFFWKGERVLKFITDCSNELKKDKTLRIQIDANYESFSKQRLNGHVNWKVRLTPQVRHQLLDFTDHPKTYDGTSLIFLLEFIRDKEQHSVEWQKNSNKMSPLTDPAIFGVNSANYGNYFLKTFPELASFLFTNLQKHQAQLTKVQEEFYKNINGIVFDEL